LPRLRRRFQKDGLLGVVLAVMLDDFHFAAVLIHRPPEIVFVPANREDDLVQMPVVAATRMATTPFIRGGLPEGEAPLPNRFRGQDNPALCQRFFDRPEN